VRVVVAEEGGERCEITNEVADDNPTPRCFGPRNAESDVCGG
jgi:hypothetical protein